MTDQAPELLPEDDSAKRARIAYDAFRSGFPAESWPMPEWEKAPAWVRDVVLVAYLQGTLDRPTPAERPEPAPDKIRHKGIFIERQLQDGGDYLFICHTGIAKFLPDLYPTKAAAIAAIDSALLSERPVPQVREALEKCRPLVESFRYQGKKYSELLDEIDRALTARPSDAAVAWRKAKYTDGPNAAMVRGSAWRPIESAPRDGTPVLVWFRGRPLVAEYGAIFVKDNLHWLVRDPPTGQEERTFTVHEIDPPNIDERPISGMWLGPTHWQPLPAPPNHESVS